MINTRHTRRQALRILSATALGAPYVISRTNNASAASVEHGHVIGEPTGEKVGLQVLADGGNAIDAIVAAALTAAIAAPHSTGIGGYGMCAVIGIEEGKRVVAIDGNSAAPASLRPDSFRPDAKGGIPGGGTASNWFQATGWHTAGVPGILAGLQLALDHFGTKPFSELVGPAIKLAQDGFLLSAGLATAINNKREIFVRDSGSRKLYFPTGEPAVAGQRFKYPELAEMLATLAKANSVDSFYRGEIARCIADGFAKNGGLVTVGDLAEYQARLVEPNSIDWDGYRIHTAPLTAGGVSVLQMMKILQALNWPQIPDPGNRLHARVEAMRLAWRDRLTLLGDPDFGNIPWRRLLSDEYARESADRILGIVKARKYLAHAAEPRAQTGTINLSAVDRKGNFVALTLTHGNAFGACVTVDGLGLTLGHGMSRFEVIPDHPNSPGPKKRPLNNMVPTLVTRDGKPIMAIGGTGGRKIPNGLMEVLTQFVILGRPLAESIAAPRLHTEGDVRLSFEAKWPADEIESLRQVGYQVDRAGNANMSAVANENGKLTSARR